MAGDEKTVSGDGEDTTTEQEWWQAEGMPWRHKPGKADVACLTWFGVAAVYGLILIPLRAWLYGQGVHVLAMITGGRTSVAATGAVASVGRLSYWPVVLVIASITSLKLDWIFWWAGKLWGRGMIEVWAGRSKRAAKSYAVAERWAEKLGPFGFVIAYVPIPLPIMQVVFVLSGAAGMSIKKFLVYDFVASATWLAGFFWLGWSLGEPVVAILDAYQKVALWVALGLMVAIIFGSFFRKGQKKEPTKG